jgi:hypothetical protein
MKKTSKIDPKAVPAGGVFQNHGKWRQRFIVGTPTTGLVRMEWVQARYSQLIPTNWSSAEIMEWLPLYAPMQYLVSDAQNIIVKKAIEQDAEWLFFLEQDNVLPPNMFWRLNDYMREGKVPVVSGLYFTKSIPPEPMVYRGVGNSYYDKWKLGDKVWCDGLPTGSLLVHMSLLRAMWNESAEYKAGDHITRRVFAEPAKVWWNPERGGFETQTGTSDLGWCDRVRKEHFFAKAGWPKYDKMRFPFLVDTNMFVRQIAENGIQYPINIPEEFRPNPKKKQDERSTTRHSAFTLQGKRKE